MEWIEQAIDSFSNFSIYRGTMDIWDVVEILIIAVILYYILVWMKTSKAWSLLKGLIVIAVFLVLAYLFQMNTILWIVQNLFSFALMAFIVVLQPELRKALEELGKRNIISQVLPFESSHKDDESFTERTIDEIAKASLEMARARTGALIVIEKQILLDDIERTGIEIDGKVSSQLLINIFEHNTPLHDGAVIIKGNRVNSATCYLPLSDTTDLSKELGTRHRAGVGMSEASDAAVVIVSEETGKISLAYEGRLERNLDTEKLKNRLMHIFNIGEEEEKTHKWGRSRSKK
ncbi:MAG: diadenylate cyclase CdaA [Lachnospiraceae bacterium]|nr:diadenylate cyclase CdaA [Lachnospiraceae bacterium]